VQPNGFGGRCERRICTYTTVLTIETVSISEPFSASDVAAVFEPQTTIDDQHKVDNSGNYLHRQANPSADLHHTVMACRSVPAVLHALNLGTDEPGYLRDRLDSAGR
jgi:hypothetical protein